jgi:hypothetical protein
MNDWEVNGIDASGFDGLVPQDGSWMGGAVNQITADTHFNAQNNPQTINMICSDLGVPASVPGATDRIVGDVRIAIEGFQSNKDMDSCPYGYGDPYYKVWVAEEQGAWQWLGEVNPGLIRSTATATSGATASTQPP